MDYIIVKWIHILSSTILFGTGVGTAFCLFVANRQKKIENISFATAYVVRADWLFTSPAIIIQLVTGLQLLYLTGYSLSDRWVQWGLALYFFAGGLLAASRLDTNKNARHGEGGLGDGNASASTILAAGSVVDYRRLPGVSSGCRHLLSHGGETIEAFRRPTTPTSPAPSG